MTHLRTYLLVLSIISLLISTTSAQQADTAKLPDTSAGKLGADLDTVARKAAETGFSGAVLVAKGGKILLHKGYGLANKERQIPVKSDTVFAIGSIAKMFTAAAIYKLEQQGKLSVNDTLPKFFDQVPLDKTGITLYQLIKHTSGLQEYHGTKGDFEEMIKEQAVKEILGQQLRFEPGKQEAYSNPGYTLLAAVVEKVTGQPFQAFMQKQIFEPAGMSNTGFWGNRRWHADKVARGYNDQVMKENSPLTWPEPSWAILGAGGLGSTVEDLYKWSLKKKGTEIFSEETKRKYFPVRPIDGIAGGTMYGFFATYAEYPNDEAVVIVFNNAGPPPRRVMELQSNLARLITHVPMPAGGERNTGMAQPSNAVKIGEGAKWPDTPVGRVAAAYFKAFNSGEQAMKEFFLTNLSNAALAARPVEPRLDFYRQVKSGMSSLEANSIVATGAHKLTVSATAKNGATPELRFEMDEAEPQKLRLFQIELK